MTELSTGTLATALIQRGLYRRWLPDWEAEAKLAILTEHQDNPTALLRRILEAADHLRIENVPDGVTCQYPVYKVEGDIEHSYFKYRGEPMVKIKRHTVENVEGIPVMVSTEQFLHGAEASQWRVQAGDTVSAPLEKRRSKAFLHDQSGMTCYSAAVTVCLVADQVQRQFELEYHSSDAREAITSTRVLAERVQRAVAPILRASPVRVEVTTETKFEFLYNATNNKEG